MSPQKTVRVESYGRYSFVIGISKFETFMKNEDIKSGVVAV